MVKPVFTLKIHGAPTAITMGGYLNMTEDYMRLKTIAILVHKDAIPAGY